MDFTALNALLGTLPGNEVITDHMRETALTRSRIPDSEGRWPHDTGYVATYDEYFAAMSLLPFLEAQPVVTSAGSEGTSVSVKPANWAGIREYFRSNSVIEATAGGVLKVLHIPDPPHVKRVPMNDRGGRYGDVDTDVG